MDDDFSSKSNRPMPRGAQRYDVLREAETTTAATNDEYENYYTATIIAQKRKGVPMDEESVFLYKLIFKPGEPGLRLRLQETQLLLANYKEMLQEITEEEQVIIEEEKMMAQSNNENNNDYN